MIAQKEQFLSLLRQIATNTENPSAETFSAGTINWLRQIHLGTAFIELFPTAKLTPSCSEQLKADKLTTRFWFQSQYEATLELASELNKVGVTITILKGMSVSTAFYPKPYYRNMRDIDLLVEQSELEQVAAIMQQLGYTQRSELPDSFYQTHHHTKPWQHPVKDIWFEIHTGLFPPSSAYSSAQVFSLQNINMEKYPQYLAETRVNRLGYELQVIYSALHWGAEFRQTGGLFGLIDIALIINNTELDWKKLIHWANEAVIANTVYVVLSYLLKNKLINNAKVKLHLHEINHSLSRLEIFLLQRLMDNYLLGGKSFGRVFTANNIAILWGLLLSPSASFKKIILFPVYIIFPPDSNQKFNPAFQLSRIKRLLFKSTE